MPDWGKPSTNQQTSPKILVRAIILFIGGTHSRLRFYRICSSLGQHVLISGARLLLDDTMAYQYVDTPRTEAGDRTHFSAGNLSFSEVQPYPSPSKDPSNNLVSQLRSKNGPQALKTPRARNALLSMRNPSARAEFTPLLKSAAHNRFFTSASKMRSFPEEKENTTDDLVNSMLAHGPGAAPQTPAYLRAGYRETHQTPALPIDSSILDGEHTGSSAGGNGTPAAPAVASSSILSTPMPVLPPRGEEGRGDQGNVLTLREQEAVSACIGV